MPQCHYRQAADFELAPDLTTCRVLNGGLWQVSGGHGYIEPGRAIADMFAYHQAGFTAWDLADHYGPAEDFIGEFRDQFAAQYGRERLPEMQAFTKWVPHPGRVTRAIAEEAIDLSLRRMHTESLDLLQFHWWEYSDASYLDALKHLADLRNEGKIRYLALTNFDTDHLAIIGEHGIPIVSNQVQYSIVDDRPARQMAAYCRNHGVTLLTYGTVLGGLLSEQYRGCREPGRAELKTVSLQKYKNMIDAWGGWALFQDLLNALGQVAAKHAVSIANVGVRYILDRPAVAGVIVGTRLGIAEHRRDNARVFALSLDPEDIVQIEQVTSKARDLYAIIGDCGDEYR